MQKSSPPIRTRRPRGSLTRELILDSAEDVAQQGFEALTLRAVAARLEAAPMALYRHFATKEELVDALLDRILGRFAPEPPTGDWIDDLRNFARAHRRLLDHHPWALAAFFSHPNPGLNATRIGEVALSILSGAGLSNEYVVASFSGLIALNYGWSAFASARDAGPIGGASQVREALAALPRSTFPRTADVAGEMADYASDRHYELVIDELLAGVRSAARSATRAKNADHRRTR
ncbi:MAG: TetR/AcrR family transcriptional regulator [Chloroflexi bacterium]|nr:TetR/AcrR family transcriptional regulator [Chloroflexota bacterium]